MPVSLRKGQSPVHSPAAIARRSEDAALWLLLVGINHYQDSDLCDLRYSAVDCQSLSEALAETTQRFAQQHLRVHHDSAHTLPTLAAVQASLSEIVANARPQDTILFYFSGHGLQTDPQSASSSSAAVQQAVLCLADTNKSALLDTGLSLQSLLAALDRSAAQQQLVWLDACHSGGMSLRGATVEALRQQAARSSGFYALLSCDQNQRSWEFPQLGHGVFTYFLMQGLRGEAANGQGTITSDSLYRYVYYQTLRYIDKANQQLRILNQQQRRRGDRQLQAEYPLQTPKRIVEGVGEHVLVQKAKPKQIQQLRRTLLIDGSQSAEESLSLGKTLSKQGGFEVSYWSQAVSDWSGIQNSIYQHLHNPTAEIALVYIKGPLIEIGPGQWEISLPGETNVSGVWLRQILQEAIAAQQIIVVDALADNQKRASQVLETWIEDVRNRSDRPLCTLSAVSPTTEPAHFVSALRATLAVADPRAGLPAAGWISQLQKQLTLTGIAFHFRLSGKGVIEVLPTQSTEQKRQRSTDIGLCPYRGLRAFKHTDAAFFFGREALVQQLLTAINQQSFLAVVGASGSGKSSVVQAGLVANLKQARQIPGSDTWWIQSMRPGGRPIRALAQQLAIAHSDPAVEALQIEGLLHLGVEGFVRWLRSRPEPMVMLIVDQFEEIFTLASDLERQQFIALLLGGLAHASDRFKLVLTLRSDFVASALEHPALAEKIQQSNLLVPAALSEEEYRQIILRPAEKVGLSVDPELTTVLLQELNQGVGDLPLLEFVLEQIWEQRRPGHLSLQVYQQQVGGLKGALERKAQAVYEALSWEEQDCARWIFLNLTQLGDGTEDTRRRVTKQDLVVEKYSRSLVEKTLQALVTAKLVVVGERPFETNPKREGSHSGLGGSRGQRQNQEAQEDRTILKPEPSQKPEVTVEVAHEILIRHWSTLQWWLEENRTRLREQRQVEAAALAWQQNHRKPDFLLRGIPLDAATELYVNYTDELPKDVQQFVEAGIAAREAETQLTQKRLKQARRAIAVISTLGIGATALGGAAYWQRQQAQLRRIEALNALSTAQLTNHQSLEATLTAIEAGELLQDVQTPIFLQSLVLGQQASAIEAQTVGTLQQAVTLGAERNRLSQHTQQVNAVAYSPNGMLMASGSDDGTLGLWRADGELLQLIMVDGDIEPVLRSRVTSVAFSPDSRTIAIAQSTGKISFWSAKKGSEKKQALRVVEAHSDWVSAIAYSPEGDRIATAGRDGFISIWTPAGKLLRSIKAHDGWANTVAWNQTGTQIVSGGEDGKLKHWSAGTGNRLWETAAHTDRVTSLAFEPNGLISVGGDGLIKRWNLQTRSAEVIGEQSGQINHVAISPDGKNVLTAGSDRTLRIWPLAQDQPAAVFQGHSSEVTAAAWHPANQQIASASQDGTLRVWQVPASDSPHFDSSNFLEARFDPTGNLLAGTTWEGEVEIWQRSGSQLKTRVATLPSEENYSPKIAFSSTTDSGKSKLVTGYENSVVKLWTIESATSSAAIDSTDVKVLPVAANERLSALAISPDGVDVLVGSADGSLTMASTETSQRWPQGHAAMVSAIAWHPTKDLIASGSEDRTIRIWNSKGQQQQQLEGHAEMIAALDFSPDGKYLVSAAWDKTIKIWNVKTGSLERTLTGHQDGVTSLAFTGQILVSGSADQTIIIWDWASGERLKALRGHRQGINNLSISPDGQLFVSSGYNDEVRLWRWNLSSLINEGCNQLADYLKAQAPESSQTLCEDVNR